MNVPNLELEVGGHNYSIPAETLLQEGHYSCDLSIKDYGLYKDMPADWIVLGQPFFKDFVQSIDYDENLYKIGLSKNAH